MSGGAQQNVQAGPVYGMGHHGSSSTIAYGGPYVPYASSTGQSSNNQQEHGFPERPGQPDCQYYMRTGDCKFGATCKYHHPRELSAPKSGYMVNSLCLPLRPVSTLKPLIRTVASMSLGVGLNFHSPNVHVFSFFLKKKAAHIFLF